jgi:hypothetical protein
LPAFGGAAWPGHWSLFSFRFPQLLSLRSGSNSRLAAGGSPAEYRAGIERGPMTHLSQGRTDLIPRNGGEDQGADDGFEKHGPARESLAGTWRKGAARAMAPGLCGWSC